jgi:hypothetical protein
MKFNILIVLLFIMQASFSCNEGGGGGESYNTKRPTSQPSSTKNDENLYSPQPAPENPSGVTESTERDIPKEDLIEREEDDNEPYQAAQVVDHVQEYLNKLMRSKEYKRRNGSLKRGKIARKLNDMGYKKKNGDRFSRRDIPKR